MSKSELEKKVIKIKKYLLGAISYKKVTQAEMGKCIGVSQQSFSKKLKTMNFSLAELLLMFSFLEVDATELILLLEERKRKCMKG